MTRTENITFLRNKIKAFNYVVKSPDIQKKSKEIYAERIREAELELEKVLKTKEKKEEVKKNG